MPRNRSSLATPALCSLLLGACGGGSDVAVTPAPPGNPPPQAAEITLMSVFTRLSFNAPVALLQAPDDESRWFVVQQDGRIFTFPNQADPAPGEVSLFADLSARVDDSASEAGLLGMAFHPDFAANREVYLSYTGFGAPLFESVIARYTVAAGGQTLDTGSEQRLLTLPQSRSNHNGGHIAFGPDGLLYAAFGDGGGGNDPDDNGQDTTNLYGTIVRIDVDGAPPYTIPAGNPFAGNTECAQGSGTLDCPEIYAFGLRNTWRFSFDRQGGALWAGDVGQGAWEEIDRIEAGGNYGWPLCEGAHPLGGDASQPCGVSGLVDPVTEYGRAIGRSVTGGFVYRGSALPGLVGSYLFADFVTGAVLSVPAAAAPGTAADERLASNLNVVSFAEDRAGELYLLDYGGTIHQVVAAP